MTVRSIIHDAKVALTEVFRRPRFIVYAILSAAGVWLLITVTMQFDFWSDIIRFSELSVATRLRIILTSLGVWGSGFTGTERIWALLIVVLSGINVALFIFFLQHRIQSARATAVGFWGTLVSLFGIGCASCGSAILTALIGFGAATSLVAALPWHGMEFTILGIIGVCISILVLAHRIASPETCRIPSTRTGVS